MNKRSFSTKKSTRAERVGGKTVIETATRTPRAPRRAKTDNAEHRGKILEAAEALFSTQGFHGTGLREIADRAGVSLGNIYNHFATKEALFEALMADLEKQYLDPSAPLASALMTISFPGELEKLGEASRESVKRFASYIRLIYVDVIEFKGTHVARLYGGMIERYRTTFADRFAASREKGEFSDADPVIAAMMSTICYTFYFTVEHLFGVKKHYGLDDDQVIREFAKVFRLGIEKR
jgi:AcrR family transcriptional regulator